MLIVLFLSLSCPAVVQAGDWVERSNAPYAGGYGDGAFHMFNRSDESDPSTHIVINEIEQNPYGIDEGNEWVELYNPTTNDVNLDGWKLSTMHGKTVTVTLGGTIPANGYFVYTHAEQWLDNKIESVILRDPSLNGIDRTPYVPDTNGTRYSWQRYPNGKDTDSDSDWEFRASTEGRSNGELPPPPKTIYVDDDFVHQGELTIPENLTLIIRGCNYTVIDGCIFIYGSLVLEDAKIMQDYSEIDYWRDIYVYGNLTSTNSTIWFSAVTARSNSTITLGNSTLDYMLRAGGYFGSAIYESNSTILIEKSIIPRLSAEGANEYIIGDDCIIDMLEEIIGVDESGRLYYWNNTIEDNSSGLTIPDVNISENAKVKSKYYCIESKGFVDVKDSTFGSAIAIYSGTIASENITTYPYGLSAWYGGAVYAHNSNLSLVRADRNSQATAVNTTIKRCIANENSNVSVVGGSINNLELWAGYSTVLFVDIGMTDIVSGDVPVHVFMQNVSKVEKVEFYVNSMLKFSDDSPEFLWIWNTTEISNNRYELLAKTYFVDGKVNKNSVEIHVYNEWSEDTQQKGDLDGDGGLTTADSVIALQMAVRGEHGDNADMNGDGQVSSVDALMILQAAAGCI